MNLRIESFTGCFTKIFLGRKCQKENALMPAGIYLLKVGNRNTRTRCQICSKLTIKTPERRQWRRSGIFIVSSEHISHFAVMFPLLTLNM